MYRTNNLPKTTLKVNDSYEGETIETKVKRILNNKEPIKDGAPQIYTERKEGVRPEFDIRTDKWDLAIEAMDIATKQQLAKRQTPTKEEKPVGGAEPTDTTTK